ncbi:hypothetical protein [Mucilaginibacter sp.]|jgi:hypothetical protein|uniref:hypothetical protein n=1 Tax=Mucilaginibacter sp. TaxID=1882438 RepID=UPI002C7422E0|nr:hypothetical protein [Mucilaginibacter sp.]HTI60108.1 hypothetical protein [Mucilaginibacter sp.]
MTFVNPIQVLGLEDYELSEITPAVIKKSKKVIYAEIELSDDGIFDNLGTKVSKSEVERVVNDLDDPDKLEFYLFIAKYPDLQSFLSKGEARFVENFRNEGMFLLPAFIKFISPFYAARFDKVIYEAYVSGTFVFFKKATSVKSLTTPSDLLLSYRQLSGYINDTKGELDQIVAGLRNKVTSYTNDSIKAAISQYKLKLSSPKLNCLPILFQDRRNAVALSFRNLSVNVYNFFDDPQLALDIIKYALSFEVNGLDKSELEKDLAEITKLKEEREEASKYDGIIKKYAGILSEGDSLNANVKKKVVNPTSVISWVNSKISITEINAFPQALNEIKSQIALVIRSLSVSVWNEWEDIDNAVRLIDKAITISTTDSTVKQNLKEAKDKLSQLKIDITNRELQKLTRSFNLPTTTPSRAITQPTVKPTHNKSQKDNSGCLVFIGIIIVVAIIIGIANSKKSQTYTSNSSTDTTKVDTTRAVSSVPSQPVAPIHEPSKYSGNSLHTGATPYNNCFGIGGWNGNSWIKFTNDNTVDAIVCLVDSLTGSTIRNNYIRAGRVFKMKQVPPGTYYVKTYSGLDWDPEMKNGCGFNGGFEKYPTFNTSIGVYNAIPITDDGFQYSTYQINLSKIINNTSSIQYSEMAFFFNNQTQ